jgi:hypothetical protein
MTEAPQLQRRPARKVGGEHERRNDRVRERRNTHEAYGDASRIARDAPGVVELRSA